MNIGRKWTLNIYSVISYGLQYAFTAIMVLLGVGVAYLGWRRLLYRMYRFWAQALFILIGKRVHIRGREHVKPNERYILVANHTSLYDIPAIIAFFPHVAWVGREYLVNIPVFGRLLRMCGYVPIYPGEFQRSARAIQTAIERAKGISVAIFPEGTRTLTGRLQPFKKGFVYLQRETALPLLPVTLNGLFSFKPKTRFQMDPASRLEVCIHPPVPAAALTGREPSEVAELIHATIESRHQSR